MTTSTFKDTPYILNLIKSAQEGNSWAENKLVKIYEPYVNYMISKYSKKTYIKEDDDLRSYIYLGLLDGIRKFDPNKGTRFIYFAHIWMKKNIFLGEAQYRFIKIPVNQKILYNKYIKKIEELEEEDEVEYFIDEDIQKFMSVENTKTKLFTDFTIYNENTNVYELPDDLFLSKSVDDFEKSQQNDSTEVLRNNINDVLSKFNEKEVYIIEHLFGLNGAEQMSSKQIAKNLNVTKVNITFTKNTVIRMMRHSILTNNILKGL